MHLISSFYLDPNQSYDQLKFWIKVKVKHKSEIIAVSVTLSEIIAVSVTLKIKVKSTKLVTVCVYDFQDQGQPPLCLP